MAKVEFDEEILKDIKKLNLKIQKGDLGVLQTASVAFAKKKKKKKKDKPIRKKSKYDCGQCVVCAVCLGTPTPDVEVAAVTGAAMVL